jgi:hypothetical protein
MSRGVSISVAAVSLVIAGVTFAQQTMSPVGGEFQVNTYTTGYQTSPSVAVNADGRFTVVWESYPMEIRGGSFDSDGSSLGAEFVVDSCPSYYGFYCLSPSLAADTSGNFVVVWSEGYFGSVGVGYTEDIYARRVAWWGETLGTQFRVNSSGTGYWDLDSRPSVASTATGQFIVAWNRSYEYPSTADGIRHRRFSSDGTPLAPDYQVNSYTPGHKDSPSISAGPGGSFIVVWGSDGSSGSDGDGWSIQGRRYTSSGVSLGAEFQVNSYASGDQKNPAVAVGPSGEFLVVWESDESGGDDTSGMSVQARRFQSDGSSIGTDFQVNTYTTADQRSPAVAVDHEGGFIVVWESYSIPVFPFASKATSDTYKWGIQGRVYSSSGAVPGAQFQVNAYTPGSQRFPAISAGPNGDVVVVWEYDPPLFVDPGPDIDWSIHGQRFQVKSSLIFADGFESGNTSAWSSAVP